MTETINARLPEKTLGSSCLVRITALLLIAGLTLLMDTASATEASKAPPTDEEIREVVVEVEQLLAKGRGAEAYTLIRPIADARPDSKAATFSLGMSALMVSDLSLRAGSSPRDAQQQEYYNIAVRSFRTVLIGEPNLLRVRLELARSLFGRGVCVQPPRNLFKHLIGDDCWAAEQHFLRVLGSGGVPPIAATRIRGFVQVIRARKRASGSLNVSLAPDTNVNTATSSETIDILGLPFQLDDEARARSGIGVVGTLGVVYQRPIPTLKWLPGSVARLRVGGQMYRRDYSGGDFDDSSYSIFAGPRFIGNRSQLNIAFQADNRTVNGRPYSRQFGLQADGAYMMFRKLWVGGGGTLARSYPLVALGDPFNPGFTANVNAFAFIPVIPSLSLRVSSGLSREKTGRLRTRHKTRWAGISLNYDLPLGFTVSGGQQLFFTGYDYGSAIFGPDPPKTRMVFSRVSAYNRAIKIMGFSPSISIIRENRTSNVGVYEYKRYRVEGGVVRVF